MNRNYNSPSAAHAPFHGGFPGAVIDHSSGEVTLPLRNGEDEVAVLFTDTETVLLSVTQDTTTATVALNPEQQATLRAALV